MSQSKKIVQEFYQHLNAGRVEEAFALSADDSVWWLAGTLPNSGPATKQDQLEAARHSSDAFAGGLQLSIKSIIAEGDHVALELEAKATLKNGASYDQEYSQHFVVRDGLIRQMRNYLDTESARRTMVAMT